ncbi:hypothetical protein [Polluticoccus soli]|uniref:hypothetical protein n=1 Tax=Polluticoccus soli TaxID=3034150 RepID=UPI0023E26D4F|nr:hypothetical protein [Flavipsychrobacter sp. JY13-12]
MKQKTRELLVTTKVAQNWQEDFDQKVEELMDIVSKVDNDNKMQQSTEMLDVYHTSTQKSKPSRKKKIVQKDRPFEFLVFCN